MAALTPPLLSTEEEVWRPSPIRGDLFEVSNLGRVRRRDNGKVKKQHVDTAGYLRTNVNLRTGPVHVHRLVAEAFLERPEGTYLVRHLNDEKFDNRAENLAWGTTKDNAADALRNGRLRVPSAPYLNGAKTHCLQGHPYDEGNTYVDPEGRRGCRKCRNVASNRYKARKRAARKAVAA